jgi:hypothetical protein
MKPLGCLSAVDLAAAINRTEESCRDATASVPARIAEIIEMAAGFSALDALLHGSA